MVEILTQDLGDVTWSDLAPEATTGHRSWNGMPGIAVSGGRPYATSTAYGDYRDTGTCSILTKRLPGGPIRVEITVGQGTVAGGTPPDVIRLGFDCGLSRPTASPSYGIELILSNGITPWGTPDSSGASIHWELHDWGAGVSRYGGGNCSSAGTVFLEVSGGVATCGGDIITGTSITYGGTTEYVSLGVGPDTTYTHTLSDLVLKSSSVVTAAAKVGFGAPAEVIPQFTPGQGVFTATMWGSGAINWAAPARGVFEALAGPEGSYAATFAGRGVFDAIVTPNGTTRRTVIVRMDGTPVAELPDVTQGPVTLALNGIDSATLTVPDDTASAEAIKADVLQEVQLWHGDRLLMWGPMSRPQGERSLEVQVSGAPWYLQRRYVGHVPLKNIVRNADMVQGQKYWGTGAGVVWRHGYGRQVMDVSSVRYPAMTKGRALKLTSLSNPGDPPQAWVSQGITWQVPADYAEGDTWSARAYCYIPSATYKGPPAHDHLLVIVRESTTEPSEFGSVLALQPNAKKVLDVQAARITDDLPRDQWVRVEATLTQPIHAGERDRIRIELHAVEGVIYWDHVGLYRSEQLHYKGVDQSTIIADLVEHAQDPAYGKSDVNLQVDAPPSGQLRDRSYLFEEHANIWDAINDFSGLHAGVDFRAAYGPTDRYLQVASPRFKRKVNTGRLIMGGAVTSGTWVWDGERAATSTIVLGEGNGATREAAISVSAGIGPDGAVLETLEVAAPETGLESLSEQSDEMLARGLAPVVLNSVTVAADDRLARLLHPGDLIVVDFGAAVIPLAGWYRVVELTIQTDGSLSLTLNIEVDDGA